METSPSKLMARLKSLADDHRKEHSKLLGTTVAASELGGRELDQVRAVYDSLLHFRTVAGEEAVAAQTSVRRIDGLVFGATVGATSAGAIGLVKPELGLGPVVLEAVLVFAVAALAGLGFRRGLHVTWVRCRFLAEMARVAMQIVPLGYDLEKDVVEQARDALPAEPNPPTALVSQFCEMLPATEGSDPPAASEAYGDHFWRFIQGQIKHHADAAKTKAEVPRLADRLGLLSFIAATLVTTIAAASAMMKWDHGEVPTQLLQFAAIVLPVLGASAFLWGIQREDDRMSGRSQRMERRLRHLETKFKAIETDEGRAKFILGVAQTLTRENYEWAVILDSAA